MGIKHRVLPMHYGSASFVTSTYNERVIRCSEEFMRHIGYSGQVGVEYKYDPRDDVYKLIEVNARFGLWDGLGARCGVDFAWLNYCHLVGLPVEVASRYEEGVKWISFERDLWAAGDYLRESGMTRWQWLHQISSGRRDYAVFELDDPVPFLLATALLARQMVGLAARQVLAGARRLFGSMVAREPAKQGLEHEPDVGGDDLVSSRIGVDAVGEVELGTATHALEQKRDQVSVVGSGEVGEDAAKRPGVVGAEVGGHLHAGQYDRDGGVDLADAIDDSLEVGPRSRDGRAA